MLHCGQYSKRRGLMALCARRLPLRAFELLRLGTAMASYLSGLAALPEAAPKAKCHKLLQSGKRVILRDTRASCQANRFHGINRGPPVVFEPPRPAYLPLAARIMEWGRAASSAKL